MSSKHRAQWIMLLVPVAIIFLGAAYLILQSKPRDIRLGAYPTQQAAISAAMEELSKGVNQWTRASSVTVHFKGPHPIPEATEEVLSYNRRLKVLLTYMNRKDGSGKWKMSKVVCPNTDEKRLSELAKQSDLLLDSPEKCGCKVEDIMQIG